jgi:adenine phosphoribosyltransferase
MAITKSNNAQTKKDRWYLDIMSPNTKGEKFAWLDPTSIYINGDAFHDLINDLVLDLKNVKCDVVAGLDAMGFVLGTALATHLNVGFLPIRKAGKLCVDTDSVTFTNYSGRTQDMEVRTPAFLSGTRVLLVDQWIETGGTMDGAIRLVKRQEGIVAGLVAIAMESNDKTDEYRECFPCITAVRPNTELQTQCDRQSLDSFKAYKPEMAFPKLLG